MHAVVLLKEILDWEIPTSRFRLDEETRRPAAGIAPMLLGPFEQHALELALQLKDAGAVTRLTALSVAPAGSVEALRKALGVRCDDAVQVVSDEIDDADPSQTAALVAAAVRRLEGVELVIAGRQAGDWDHGQVGYLVAERLERPCVGLVFRAEPDEGRLRVWRVAPGGIEQIGVRTPAVLTVTSDPRLQLRLPKVTDRMAANKKTIVTWTASELGVSAGDHRRVVLGRVWVPEQDRNCEMIEAADPNEVAQAVRDRLAQLKLLEVVS